MLSIKVGQVDYLRPGDRLDIKQSKTQKHRATTINNVSVEAIENWLRHHPETDKDAPLFLSQKGGALLVPVVTNMVKLWCRKAGLRGNYGSHTLRKTWGYHQLRQNKRTRPHMVLPILMDAYGHSSQQQTLDYLCIQSDEVANLFMQVEL